jgi:hypothetical protein
MTFTHYCAVRYALIAWGLYIAALFVRFFTSPPACSVISRWNVFDGVPSALVFVASLVFFGFAGVRAWQGGVSSSPRWLLVLLLCAFVVVPFNTHDMSYYYGIGRAVAEGVNVYDGSWVFHNVYSCSGTAQEMHGVMYGPLAVFGMGAVAAIAPSIGVFALWWKLLMVIAVLLCVRVISVLVPHVSRDQTLLFFIVQPLILWETVGSGHFDLWWVLPLLGAIYMAKCGTWVWVLPLVALGVWIKFLPILALPWFILWWWQELRRESWLRHVGMFALGAGIALCITYVAWQPFWTGSHVVMPIILQTKWAVSSVFAAVYYTLRPLADAMLQGEAHWWLTRAVQGSLALLIAYMLFAFVPQGLRVLTRRSEASPQWFVLGITLMYVVYVMLWQKSFWPWYISWVLPLICLAYYMSPSEALRKIGVYLSAAPLAFYALWILNHVLRGTDAASELWFYLTVVSVVWVYPFCVLWRFRKRGYSTTS